MLLLPTSRLARQGNFSILRFVIRVSNRRFSTRSREQLSVTTSHEARSATLRLGDSAGPLGNFSILSLSVSMSNRPLATLAASANSTHQQLRGVGTSILDPEVGTLNECCFQMGGGSPLEGGKAFRPLRFPVGRTSNKLRGFGNRGKSRPQPGRVALEFRGITRIRCIRHRSLWRPRPPAA